MTRHRLRMLDSLEQAWKDCSNCREIAVRRSKVVHWRGNPDAPLAIIGEAPGFDEDRTGLPFVGRAGKLLDDLLQEAGLEPTQDVFVCNMLACRPPSNRTPRPEEIRSCSPRLTYMLGRIVKPKALLLLGTTAARLVCVRNAISQHRGLEKIAEVLGHNRTVYEWPAIVTFHPSYLLRNASDIVRAQIVEDIRKAQAIAQK